MKNSRLGIVLISGAVVIASVAAAWTGSVNPQQKEKKKVRQYERIVTNPEGTGPQIEMKFYHGPDHNHPVVAVWLEDTSGQYLQSLFVVRSIATGIFRYGDASGGSWTQGEIRRPAAVPYWAHKRGIMEKDGLFMPTPSNPVPDAYSGATPAGDFVLATKADSPGSGVYDILLEINQPWDWNNFWTNAKYPDNYEYKTSAQPAVVYKARLDLRQPGQEFRMVPVGHSHFAGETGELFPDLSTLTTSLEIADSVTVRIIPE